MLAGKRALEENRRPKRNNFSGHRVHLQNNATQDNPVTAETEGYFLTFFITHCSKSTIGELLLNFLVL